MSQQQQPPPYGPGGSQGTGMPQGARMQMAGQQGMNRGMMNQGNSQANFMANRMAQQQHAGRMPMQQGKGVTYNMILMHILIKYKRLTIL